jgi:hypothetical protein
MEICPVARFLLELSIPFRYGALFQPLDIHIRSSDPLKREKMLEIF